jgi:hypothetical protein
VSPAILNREPEPSRRENAAMRPQRVAVLGVSVLATRMLARAMVAEEAGKSGAEGQARRRAERLAGARNLAVENQVRR